MPPKNLTRQPYTQTAPQQSHTLHTFTPCQPKNTRQSNTQTAPQNSHASHALTPCPAICTPGNFIHKQPRNNPTPYTPSRHARQYAHEAISYANSPATISRLTHLHTMPAQKSHPATLHTNSPATIPRLTRLHAMSANMHTRQSHTQIAPQNSTPYTL